jgi:hypothetical protein
MISSEKRLYHNTFWEINMMNPAERTEKLSHLKEKMREMEVLFEETEATLGGLAEDEKRSLKGLASAIEYHASKLKG